jgi:hypothetical protein
MLFLAIFFVPMLMQCLAGVSLFFSDSHPVRNFVDFYNSLQFLISLLFDLVLNNRKKMHNISEETNFFPFFHRT